MDGWREPIGPEPARTYWIRRAIVVGAIILVLAVVSAIVAALLPKAVTPAASTTSATTARETAVTSASAATTTSSAPPATAATPTATPASASPTGPVDCDASNLTLAVTGDASVTSGGTTTLTLTLTNTGTTECTLDVNPTTTIVRITSGSDRIWSTEDCDSWLGQSTRETVAAGKALQWTLEWNTKRSSSGCTLSGSYLQAGTYIARASYDTGVTGSLVMYLHG